MLFAGILKSFAINLAQIAKSMERLFQKLKPEILQIPGGPMYDEQIAGGPPVMGLEKNKNITEELDRYLSSRDNAFYAVQIDASWGAGKTHFIKKYMDNLGRDKENDDIPRGLYVTFFGVQSISDLEKQVVAQLFGRYARLLAIVTSGALLDAAKFVQASGVAQSTMGEASGFLLSRRLESIRDGLVIFDDVERSGMPLKDTLGYINRFVEQEGFKVVVVSNERALLRENASSQERRDAETLKSFKEKIIGRSLRLRSDPESAYVDFVSRMVSLKAKDFAKEHSVRVVQVFDASARENLRSLRIGVEAFDRLFAILHDEVTSKPYALREILVSCVYVAMEVCGAENTSVISEPERGRIGAFVDRNADVGNGGSHPSVVQAEGIFSRYGDFLNLRTPVIPFTYIVEIIAFGDFDILGINDAAKSSPLVAGPLSVPPWRSLIGIWDLSEDVLLRDTARALDKFHHLQVRDPVEMFHLAGIMLWRQSKGDLSLSKNQPPLVFIREYLSRLHESGGAIEVKFDRISFDRLSAGGYIALSAEENQNDLRVVVDLIRDSMKISAQGRFPNVRAEFFRKILSEDRDFRLINYGLGEFSEYMKMPVFEGSVAADFADIILREKGFDYPLLDWLAERYTIRSEVDTSNSERGWLIDLCHELSRRVRLASPPLNAFWLENLDRKFRPVWDNLGVEINICENVAGSASGFDSENTRVQPS